MLNRMLDLKTDIYKAYLHYIDSFAESTGLHPLLVLKKEHSLRVAQEAALLAGLEGFTSEETVLAEICGLLHDAGRFFQFTRYHTFHDAVSINHGEKSAEILEQSGLLNNFSVEQKKIIVASARYHNIRFLPVDCTALRFVKTVRDSDKLDIFFTISQAINHKVYKNYQEIFWNFPPEKPANPELIRELEEKTPCDMKKVQSRTDFLLLMYSWVYDFHFRSSLEQLIKRGQLELIKAAMITDPALEKAMENVQKFINEQQITKTVAANVQMRLNNRLQQTD